MSPSQLWKWLRESGGLLVLLVGGILTLGYFLFFRIPDLEKRLDAIEKSQTTFQTDSKKESQEFRDLLLLTQKQEYARINEQILNLRVNLLRLCSKGAQIEKA